MDTTHKDQIGVCEVDFTDDRGISGQFSQTVLDCFFQSVRHVPADFLGLLLPGFFRTSYSQFVVLPVHAECEKKKDQGRQKNRTSKKKDLPLMVSLWPAGRKRIHFVIVSFSEAGLS